MNKVFVRGLEISACHGVNDFEKVQPQKFLLDIDIETDFYETAKSDELGDTINYSALCKVVTAVVQNNVYNLIEKLAYECMFAVFENFKSAKKVTVTVYKPEAPMKRKFESVGVMVEAEKKEVYLSLGSSLGDRKYYLDEGIKKLNSTRGIEVEKVSSYIETPPYGGVAKNYFLNCAAKIYTILTPHELLDEIHAIERELKRERKEHWADRTLDIDIIFFGDKLINDETLTIPHPDYLNRDFVKNPLFEIAPHLIHRK